MERIKAIEELMETITDEIVVSSCGLISREIFATKDRDLNFYNQGAMGSTLGIGIGLAISKPEKKVVVIAGDGEILMSLRTLVLMKKLDLPNLSLFILDNKAYESTGGQPTCSDSIDFRLLCYCKVIFVSKSKKQVPRISIKHKDIKERFMNAIK